MAHHGFTEKSKSFDQKLGKADEATEDWNLSRLKQCNVGTERNRTQERDSLLQKLPNLWSSPS